jgi:hypothetical protein
VEDFEDSGDDENAISVDNLLADAANDPDSDLDDDKSEEELNGSPLSAGSTLAPANSSHRNVLLSAFHDAAQACRVRNLSPVHDSQSPGLPSTTSATRTSSQTSTTSTSIGNTSLPVMQRDSENTPSESNNRPHNDLHSPPHHLPARNTVPGTLTDLNMNGKRTRRLENAPDHPSVVAKKPRGGVSKRGALPGVSGQASNK